MNQASQTRPRRLAPWVLPLTLALLAAPVVSAQTADPSGRWEGEIELPANQKLGVIVELSEEDGTWSGTIDIPVQNAKGLPLENVVVEPPSVAFQIAGVAGEPRFEGTIEASDSIRGAFRQGALEATFHLGRDAVAGNARPQEPKPPFPYASEEVTYDGEVGVLAGTLTLPAGEGPFPAVLLITGSGAQDRDETLLGHKPFLVLADHLTRRGVAVLRVDDRGVGGSVGNLAEAGIEGLAEDALRGVAFLRARPEIDGAKVGVLGHSEGGIVGPLAASRSDDIAFVILYGGTGVPGDEVLAHQNHLLFTAVGADPDYVERRVAAVREMTAVFRQDLDPATLRSKLRERIEALIAIDGEEATDEQINALVLNYAGKTMASFLVHDPRPALRQVKAPVLVLNGDLDLQVHPSQNLPAIVQALSDAENPDVTIVRLPRLNHLFQTAETGAATEYGTIEETIAPHVLTLTSDWIRARFTSP